MVVYSYTACNLLVQKMIPRLFLEINELLIFQLLYNPQAIALATHHCSRKTEKAVKMLGKCCKNVRQI